MLYLDEKSPLRESWYGQKLRLQIEGLNSTHCEFSVGLSGEDGEAREMQVFGHFTGNKLIPFYSGTVLGAYATTYGT